MKPSASLLSAQRPEPNPHAEIIRALRQPIGSPRRFLLNHFFDALCFFVSATALVPLLSLVYLVVQKGLPLVSWKLFTELPPAPGLTGGGIGNALLGTAFMVGMAMAMTMPLGILAAIYICEYSTHSRLARSVRFTSKILTGIPSIIAGVFAFGVLVLTMGRFSALAGSVALAVLALPTIILTTEQALLAVPASYREAAYALGATRFQTIRRTVLPEAMPTIITGIMLAVARAAGESAPLLFTALSNAYWNFSPFEQTASLSLLIFNNATRPFDYQMQLAWAASFVLVALVTITNVVAQRMFIRRNQP